MTHEGSTMLFESQIISRASGSIGGLVASHNKGGNYFRARTTPTDPGTVFQTKVRTDMAGLVDAWNSVLTQAQRDAWAVYAANVPLLNPFGEPRTVTALNMYCRVNVPRLQAGLTRIDPAPVDFNTGEFTNIGMAAGEVAGILIVFDNTDDWANEDDSSMLVFASRPQNIGIQFFKGPYRLAGTIDGDSTTPPSSPATFAVPPFSIMQGQRLFTRVAVARADGRYSTAQRSTVLVAS
ncbi:MAG: hypothetical protein IH940_00675 [Acidobacteria bacterium]|nr:hypothetical protein [Acidobacteriota bacterium]